MKIITSAGRVLRMKANPFTRHLGSFIFRRNLARPSTNFCPILSPHFDTNADRANVLVRNAYYTRTRVYFVVYPRRDNSRRQVDRFFPKTRALTVSGRRKPYVKYARTSNRARSAVNKDRARPSENGSTRNFERKNPRLRTSRQVP